MNIKRIIIVVFSISIIITSFFLGQDSVSSSYFDILIKNDDVFLNYNLKDEGTVKVYKVESNKLVFKRKLTNLKGKMYFNNLAKNQIYKFCFYNEKGKRIIKKEKFIYDYKAISELPIISLNTEENKIPKADVLYPEDPLSCWGYTTINNTKVEGIMDMYKDGD